MISGITVCVIAVWCLWIVSAATNPSILTPDNEGMEPRLLTYDDLVDYDVAEQKLKFKEKSHGCLTFDDDGTTVACMMAVITPPHQTITIPAWQAA